MEIDQHDLNGLLLFIELIKDGCKWEGETFSRKYSEVLRYSLEDEERVLKTLKSFKEGEEYRLEQRYMTVFVR